jgi:hypothetical protein
MEAIDWTRPDAYGVDDADFHAVVADVGVRQMYRAFDRMAAPLDRASGRTRSPALRAEIDAAVSAMVGAASVQDALGRTLGGEGPVALASVLHDVCRNLLTGPAPGVPPALELADDVAFTLTERSVAWAIAAAVVEMAELTGARAPVRIRAEFVDGHLAIVVAAGGSRRPMRRAPAPAPRLSTGWPHCSRRGSSGEPLSAAGAASRSC